jgi:hypothetical protein
MKPSQLGKLGIAQALDTNGQSRTTSRHNIAQHGIRQRIRIGLARELVNSWRTSRNAADESAQRLS